MTHRWHKCMGSGIFFLILQINVLTVLNSPNLRSILSKKQSLEWIDSFNNSNVSNNSYCHLCCINIKTRTVGKRCGLHTLCKYKEGQIGSRCKGYIPIDFTRIEKEAIVDAHNTLRDLVASGREAGGSFGQQPSSSNMRALQWNDELAHIADLWAAQCIYANDICRDIKRFPVGQNVARGNFATNNILTFINSWYEEVNFFNSADVSSFKFAGSDSESTTMYTQMMWAETYLVGCARAVFQSNVGAEVSYIEHMFCNYGPSGNIPNQPVYWKGTPCTACQEGTSCTIDYPSLCEVDLINKPINDKLKEKLRKIKMKNNGSVIRSYLLYYYIFIIYILICLV